MPAFPGPIGWVALFIALSAGGTWLARRYALARSLIDHPDERRSHAVATPRGGGIAIVAAFIVAMVAVLVRQPDWIVVLGPAMAGLVMVAAIGWVDDHRPLSPGARLAVHVMAAGLLALGCLAAGRDAWEAAFAFALALVLVNAWNFIDGINGIAATQAALVAVLCASALPAGSAGWLLACALLGACVGFLPFNFPVARIFLGDVGSGTLGYALALLLVLSGGAQPVGAWLLLPLSACLLDVALTLGTRIVRRERWWTPHVQHLYQRLARRWSGHAGVTLAYAAWTIASAALAFHVRSGGLVTIMCAVLVWYALGAVVWLAARRVSC
jgi:UDP-N-acetylmuramyl pentapeptide phosphotransferase/UDP-N-acetylglucosamine-1-phosphate transferase